MEIFMYQINIQHSLQYFRHGHEGHCAEVLVSQVTRHPIVDVKICICGDAQSGKTTLVGTLSLQAFMLLEDVFISI